MLDLLHLLYYEPCKEASIVAPSKFCIPRYIEFLLFSQEHKGTGGRILGVCLRPELTLTWPPPSIQWDIVELWCDEEHRRVTQHSTPKTKSPCALLLPAFSSVFFHLLELPHLMNGLSSTERDSQSHCFPLSRKERDRLMLSALSR